MAIKIILVDDSGNQEKTVLDSGILYLTNPLYCNIIMARFRG